MLYSQGTYSHDSVFATRIKERENEKSAVAEFVVKRFLGNGMSAFISDGSSTFYVALSIYQEQREQFVLCTNSIPIVHEYPSWRTKGKWPVEAFEVYIPGGRVNAELAMVGTERAYKIIERRMVKRIEWVILSMSSFFADYGPAGKESDSIEIKRAAIRGARKYGKKIMFVGDHTKFSTDYDQSIPTVFSSSGKWNDLLENMQVYIVTTLPPDTSSKEMEEKGPSKNKPKNGVEWYARNTWKVRCKLNTQETKPRFLEIPCPPKQPVEKRAS